MSLLLKSGWHYTMTQLLVQATIFTRRRLDYFVCRATVAVFGKREEEVISSWPYCSI